MPRKSDYVSLETYDSQPERYVYRSAAVRRYTRCTETEPPTGDQTAQSSVPRLNQYHDL